MNKHGTVKNNSGNTLGFRPEEDVLIILEHETIKSKRAKSRVVNQCIRLGWKDVLRGERIEESAIIEIEKAAHFSSSEAVTVSDAPASLAARLAAQQAPQQSRATGAPNVPAFAPSKSAHKAKGHRK